MALWRVCCRRWRSLGGLHLQSRQLRLSLHGSDQNIPNPREAPPTVASLIWLRVVAAGAIGMIAWRGRLWAIPLSILLPCLIAVQPNRCAAGATSFAYYAAASFPVIAVAKEYWPSNEAGAVLMWLAAAAFLSVPWFSAGRDWNSFGRGPRPSRSHSALYRRFALSVGRRRCCPPECSFRIRLGSALPPLWHSQVC
jgi:hypothetical protein